MQHSGGSETITSTRKRGGDGGEEIAMNGGEGGNVIAKLGGSETIASRIGGSETKVRPGTKIEVVWTSASKRSK